LFLHKITYFQNFNTLYTSNYPLLIIHFMTNETYPNCTKFILMKIHKYTNILKAISLNYNLYNSCNHFSKSWGCNILCVYMWSLVPFTMNAPFCDCFLRNILRIFLKYSFKNLSIFIIKNSYYFVKNLAKKGIFKKIQIHSQVLLQLKSKCYSVLWMFLLMFYSLD